MQERQQILKDFLTMIKLMLHKIMKLIGLLNIHFQIWEVMLNGIMMTQMILHMKMMVLLENKSWEESQKHVMD